ncbi:hypothetical protein BU15DRAFT_67332 [Melanogaster broomeanus]|nr:hypothetical protein BU15DRAFT_67332 [Melanogaster broomeanus]
MKLDPPTQNTHALQFYGFPVNREWLKAVGRRKMKPEYHPFADDLCMSAYALQLFRYYTRIDALTYKYVRNPGDAPPDCVTSGNEVLIVSRNVDRLQEILKAGPPRWWEDAEWDAYNCEKYEVVGKYLSFNREVFKFGCPFIIVNVFIANMENVRVTDELYQHPSHVRILAPTKISPCMLNPLLKVRRHAKQVAIMTRAPLKKSVNYEYYLWVVQRKEQPKEKKTTVLCQCPMEWVSPRTPHTTLKLSISSETINTPLKEISPRNSHRPE